MNARDLLARLSASQPLSGSELAAKLGVTRAAVWKQIEALRALGAPIEGTAGEGYRLTWPVELLDASVIVAQLTPAQKQRVGAIQTPWQTDSTNTQLLQRASLDADDLLVCCAEMQSAGRGRRERSWRSPLCGNVYFSLLKRFSEGMGTLSGLSLAVGVATLDALRDCGIASARLKWPNDILVDERKLAGILIELGGEFLGPCHAVIGIGINVRLNASMLEKIDQPAIDLASITESVVPSRNRLVACLLARLIDTLDIFAEHGFSAFQTRFAQADALAGRRVTVHSAGAASEGVGDGVDARGALRVRHGDTIVCYDSAEVSVRPT